MVAMMVVEIITGVLTSHSLYIFFLIFCLLCLPSNIIMNSLKAMAHLYKGFPNCNDLNKWWYHSLDHL